ncbi:helix-turn-helix domain-containing protein [Micromonospora olivasterospora]|uniref:Homeodomain-containing protein n=1 Tax=Micromonospora olivasterospora TaxID=1880 RepID=A0A562IH30_MICOL|nr:helix-turn-helix domain-containing protein [Micromonospora olivasterospora]TWH70250.1 homeodomain-containing protein [Micromonospora olivasterospora]
MVERPGVLRVNDRVVFAGTTHTVVAISGASIRLLSAAGATTVVALAYLLAAPDFELVGAAPAPRVDPHGLLKAPPAQVVRAARDWERHLIEVETGLAPEGTVPRPGYDPATFTLAAREAAKAAELTDAGAKTSVRTVQRMRRRYREQGLWGLVDTRHARVAKPTGHVDARVVAAAVAVIERQTGTSTGTKSRALRQIRELLDEEHGPGVVKMPSQATCYRLLEVLSAGRHTFGSAVTRRQTANKPAGAYTATTASRPGEQVQMDSTRWTCWRSWMTGSPAERNSFSRSTSPPARSALACCGRSGRRRSTRRCCWPG